MTKLNEIVQLGMPLSPIKHSAFLGRQRVCPYAQSSNRNEETRIRLAPECLLS